tara:strand:- start:1096 stop:2019 length:924 start_codon:yes stop_codon:yes gene_type:complete
MATIDLGKIKLVWRGTYNNSTAYTVDDVVAYTDSGILSSYICTTNSTGNAPSSSGTAHGSWAYLAKGTAAGFSSPLTTGGDIMFHNGTTDARLAKGTAGQVLKMNSGATAPEWGTDSTYTSPLTTQGDILYRDGSGEQRLAKGTAGQILKMNSGATAPEWGAAAAGGKVLQITHRATNTYTSSSSQSYVATDNYGSITPSDSSHKVWVMMNGQCGNNGSSDPWQYVRVYRKIGSGSFTEIDDARRACPGAGASLVKDVLFNFLDSPNTTSEVTYKVYFYGGAAGSGYNGRGSNEASRAYCTLLEIDT